MFDVEEENENIGDYDNTNIGEADRIHDSVPIEKDAGYSVPFGDDPDDSLYSGYSIPAQAVGKPKKTKHSYLEIGVGATPGDAVESQTDDVYSVATDDNAEAPKSAHANNCPIVLTDFDKDADDASKDKTWEFANISSC